MFLFSPAYQDVASLGKSTSMLWWQSLTMHKACLPHYTSGQTYYYPAFNASRPEDAIKFAREFGQVMSIPVMVDAITRIRASRGNPRL